MNTNKANGGRLQCPQGIISSAGSVTRHTGWILESGAKRKVRKVWVLPALKSLAMLATPDFCLGVNEKICSFKFLTGRGKR